MPRGYFLLPGPGASSADSFSASAACGGYSYSSGIERPHEGFFDQVSQTTAAFDGAADRFPRGEPARRAPPQSTGTRTIGAARPDDGSLTRAAEPAVFVRAHQDLPWDIRYPAAEAARLPGIRGAAEAAALLRQSGPSGGTLARDSYPRTQEYRTAKQAQMGQLIDLIGNIFCDGRFGTGGIHPSGGCGAGADRDDRLAGRRTGAPCRA